MFINISMRRRIKKAFVAKRLLILLIIAVCGACPFTVWEIFAIYIILINNNILNAKVLLFFFMRQRCLDEFSEDSVRSVGT